MDIRKYLVDLLNSGATPETQRKMASSMSAQELFHALANPDAVLNSPAANVGSGFAPIGIGGVMTYHGTPHRFENFDLGRIGTGEGTQYRGRGIYVAEHPATAQTYKPEGGMLYRQDLPDEVLPKMLQLDKKLGEQSEEVKAALKKMNIHAPETTGEELLTNMAPADHAYFARYGIPGASFFDAASRSAGKGTKNHVVWDEDLLRRMTPQPVE